VCVCVRACACVCARVCVCVWLWLCLCAGDCVCFHLCMPSPSRWLALLTSCLFLDLHTYIPVMYIYIHKCILVWYVRVQTYTIIRISYKWLPTNNMYLTHNKTRDHSLSQNIQVKNNTFACIFAYIMYIYWPHNKAPYHRRPNANQWGDACNLCKGNWRRHYKFEGQKYKARKRAKESKRRSIEHEMTWSAEQK